MTQTSTRSTSSAQARHHQSAGQAVRRHRPALDGIRALAIVLVMIYHATNEQPVGGFFSVDVFFVLSGYLITGLLVAEKHKWGSIDLPRFYLRRARRLFPGLILVILGVTLVCPHFVDDFAKSSMRGDGLSTIFYYVNWHLIATGQSYFAQTGDPSPYRQMWTLAIEEQFYVILPVLTIAAMTLLRGNRRRFAWVLLALAVLSALWMAHLHVPGSDPSRVYYGTDTRAQDLLLGSALASWMAVTDRRRWARRQGTLTAIGSTAVLVMVTMFLAVPYTANFTYNGGFFLFVAATCALIFVVELQPSGVFARVFGVRWWAWIGKISYGLYLWHWPIFVMISPSHVDLPAGVIFVLRFVLSFACGAASFYFVEEPIRLHGIKRYVGRLTAIVIGFLALPVTGVAVAAASPTPDSALLNAQAGQHQVIATGATDAKTRVLLEGDSVAFGAGVNFPSADHPGIGVHGTPVPGCGLASQWIVVKGVPQGATDNADCRGQVGTWLSDAQAYKPDVVLLMESGWDILDHKIDGRVMTETSPEYAAYELRQLDDALKAFGPTAHVVIPNIPCIKNYSPDPSYEAIAEERNQPQRWAAMNSILNRFAAAHPGRVTIFDLGAKVCPGGKYTNTIDGVGKVRADGLHFTPEGAKLFWKWIMPTLQAAAQKVPGT